MNSRSFTLAELCDHLQQQVNGTVYPPGRRVQVALASYCIVQEHHVAIAVLLDEGLYASAFALSRALYEATVKGLWISHCATEAKAEKYARGQELPELQKLVDDLSNATIPAVVQIHLGNVKKKYWKVLSSLTHAGHAQVKRWLSPLGVEPVYTEAEVREVVNFTAFFAIVASMERARLGANQQAMSEIALLLPTAYSAESDRRFRLKVTGESGAK